MNIQFTYKAHLNELPTIAEQLHQLWRVAVLLDTLGIPLEDWCPPADTPDNARRNSAFDRTGPSAAALAIFKENERSDPVENYRHLGVWNGQEDKGGAVMLYGLQAGTSTANSSFTLQSKAVPVLTQKKNLIAVINFLLEVWQAPFIEVSPAPYRTRHKVFDDRPGVGWMLYLPEVLTPAQVPEASELIRVQEIDGKSKGTIIVSVPDEIFLVKDKKHIEMANAIEIRLADQDLLPRFSNL